MSSGTSPKKQLKKLKRIKKVLVTFEVIVGVVLFLFASILFIPVVRAEAIKIAASTTIGQKILAMIGSDSYNESVFDADFNSDNIKTNELKYKYSEEYTNFVLFGVDSRQGEVEASNSDSILIVSIHNTTGEVKMISVYRDSLLGIYDAGGTLTNYFKVNSAYAGGGPEAAINTLNMNLDLDISDYVTVNFAGVAKIIDSLGGIKVNLTDDEVAQLNHHLKSTISSAGQYAPNVKHSGKNISLNGIQATTYCRIRKATFYDPDTDEAISNDFGRAARQRLVMTKLIAKAKEAGISELQDMVQTVLDENKAGDKIISTSFTFEEIVNMLPIIMEFELSGSEGFPSNLTTGTISGASYVIPLGIRANVSALHEFLFGEKDYQPTENVNSVSAYVENYTGYNEYSSGGYNIGDTSDTEKKTGSSQSVGSHDPIDMDYDDKGNSEYY